MKEKLKKQTGLWIDYDILFSRLSPLEKLVLADIVVLCNSGNVFFKTNKVMADTFNVSLRTINYSMRSLTDKKLIVSKVTMPYGNVKKKRIVVPKKGYITKLKRL